MVLNILLWFTATWILIDVVGTMVHVAAGVHPSYSKATWVMNSIAYTAFVALILFASVKGVSAL